MDNFEKFREILPEKSKLYGSLSDKHISDEDYEHIPKVWKALKMKNMKNILICI